MAGGRRPTPCDAERRWPPSQAFAGAMERRAGAVADTGSPRELRPATVPVGRPGASRGHNVSETNGRRGGASGGERVPPLSQHPAAPFSPRLGGRSQRLPSDPQSLGDMQQQLQKTLTSPADAAGFLHGSRGSGGSSKDSSCDTDDFVMVPAQFPGQGPGLALFPCLWASGGVLGAVPRRLGCGQSRVLPATSGWLWAGCLCSGPAPTRPTPPSRCSQEGSCQLGPEHRQRCGTAQSLPKSGPGVLGSSHAAGR